MEPWSLAVPDWRDRIRAGRSLLPDLPDLNRAQANRAIAIFNKLRLPDVIGTPALAEAGADWFREIVGALHGSFDLVARERMIREIFLLAPKKSSKTSYAAALMVTTLLMNERPRAEFLLVAEVGIAGNDRVVGITQGWKLTGAIKTAERKLADGTLVHGGTGLMAWAVGNAKVEPRGNAIA